MNCWLIQIIQRMTALIFRGRRFYCPLCETSYRRFLAAGNERRANVRCPGCGSLERHRLLWVALNKLWDSGQLTKGGALLHIAPEKSLTDKFNNIYDYLSADMDSSKAMVLMDITAISFPEASFDAIVCNHVLEHVPQDRKALAELYRVLKPGGWGSVQVPLGGEKTKENPSITDPAIRERLYGQSDHVRSYGVDYINRLNEAGFRVLTLLKSEIVDRYEQERLSVACENEVILVIKPMHPRCLPIEVPE